MLRGWDEKERELNAETQSSQRRGRVQTEGTEVGAQSAEKRTQEHRQECLCHRRGQTQERSPGWLCHGWDFGFGNREEDGLVRGAEFVMIWMFLVSRGYSAADCL